MNALEDLFSDLNIELTVQEPISMAELDAAPPAPPEPKPFSAPSPFDPRYTELAVDALDRLAPASAMLTENDPWAAMPTRPYDVPVEELFGEVHSSMLTVPVALGDLPDEAYPTEVTLTALW